MYESNNQCSNVGGSANDPFCDQFNYEPESGADGNHFCCSCEILSVTGTSIPAEGTAGTPGLAYCFGSRNGGQGGDSRPLSNPTTVDVPKLLAAPLDRSSQKLFTALAVSQESYSSSQLISPFVCAIAADSGAPWCWGRFQLSNETLWSPTLVPGARTFTNIAAGGTYACGIDYESNLACWSGVASEPVVISGYSFSGLAMSVNSTCGLSGTTVWCWGRLVLTNSIYPMAVVAIGAKGFVSISAGPSQTCGVATTADIWCWLVAADGKSIGAKLVATGPFTFVTVGKDAACAADIYGHASCWGLNPNNWLGLEDVSAIVTTPSPIRNLLAFSSLSVGSAAGEAHICGILHNSGELVCWGNTAFGRTGTGYPLGTLSFPAPVDVSKMQPITSTIAYSVATASSYTCSIFSAQILDAASNIKWLCQQSGWQWTWNGTDCIHIPDCDTVLWDSSWDGQSCELDFAPASCNSKDFSYNPNELRCGEPFAPPAHGAISNWVNKLPTPNHPFPLNASAATGETAWALPSRNTPLGSAVNFDEETGTVSIYLTITLLGVPASTFDGPARIAFGMAVLNSLASMGVQGNMSEALVVVTSAQDIVTTVDDGTAAAEVRLRRAAGIGSSKSKAVARRAALVSVTALEINFFITSTDATFALQVATLALFAANGTNDEAAVQAGLTTASAGYLGAAFLSALAGALQASTTTTAFAAASILSMSTMPASVPTTSITPSPSPTYTITQIASPSSLGRNASFGAAANIVSAAKPLNDGAIVGIVIAALVLAALFTAGVIKARQGSTGGGTPAGSPNSSATGLNEMAAAADDLAIIGINPSLTTVAGVGNLSQYRSTAAAKIVGGHTRGDSNNTNLFVDAGVAGGGSAGEDGAVETQVDSPNTAAASAISIHNSSA